MKRSIAIIGAAYLITWGGGWLAHIHEMSALARNLYARAEAGNAKSLAWERESPELESAGLVALRPGGPKSVVNWSVPLLPGLLLASSEYEIGPLYAKGTVKIVLYYGLGSLTLTQTRGWMS